MNSPKILVATSREPYTHYHDAAGSLTCRMPPGGVHRALDTILRRRKGVWTAWGSGVADREAVNGNDIVTVPPEHPTYPLRRIWLTKREAENFYQGFSNQVLWPLMHSLPSKVRFRRRFWEGYKKVNRRFAQAVDEESRRFHISRIWIHDYQLALVPWHLRSTHPDMSIAHFWHIPWPGRDIYRTLPQANAILTSLLHCDWIGFHLEEYMENFLRCVELELGAKVYARKKVVKWKGRRISVRAFPISVDFKQLRELADRADFEKKLSSLRRKFGIRSENYGVGVERMDYSKGILERLDGLRIFFRRYPESKGKFSFLQIAPSSRETIPKYIEHRNHVIAEVRRINKLYGTRTWKPISLVEKNIAQSELALLYRGARVALVTSLRDGMNLVAKEFVASQSDHRGMLILSRFAGAAKEMKEALLINPFDVEAITVALRRVSLMSDEERRARLTPIQERIRKNDVHAWAENVLEDIEKNGARSKS